ncbi:MAG: hypothetical protein ABIG64_06420 [Candidatus Omnitrophota bacterium]
MTEEFTNLVGKIIQNCGLLELLVNNSVKALSTDNLLSAKIIKFPYQRRIDVLKSLLKERTELEITDIDSLYCDLKEISEQRNIIAHNPIASDDPDNNAEPYILIVKHQSETPNVEKMGSTELKKILKKSNDTLIKYIKLIPESKIT